MAATSQPEAGSLSTINYLAANPPQYPYHPELRESLALYISRVPGTQDIILSTFRPQKKNVTGEDITSSLYYVHLDSPGDGLLAAPQGREGAVSPRSSSESARSAIPRKPLPTTAKVVQPDSSAPNGGLRQPPTTSPAPASQASRVLASENPVPPPRYEAASEAGTVEGYRENPMFRKRKPGGISDAPPHFSHRPTPSAALIPRKELRPRPLSASSADFGPGVHPASDAATAGERPVTPTRPGTLAAPPAATQARHIPSPTSALYQTSSLSPEISGRRPASLSFSLTIIRRDPSTGTQCNVGKVSSFQTNVPTPDTADPSLDPDNMGGLLPQAQKIDIRLETSGYAKYRDMLSRAEVDAQRPTSGHSFAQQVMQGGMAGSKGEKGSSALKPAWNMRPAEEGFSRQVAMSYGASWKSNLKKAFQRRDRPGSPGHASTSPPEGRQAAAAPRPFHSRQGSASIIGSIDSADGRHSPTLITHPGPGLKPKGYVFLSPWNGRCEFRTSIDGRSLKCRHILAAASARLDPREVAQSIRDAQAMGRSRGDELSSALVGAKPVSELRFNLPQGHSHQQPSQGGRSRGGRWDSNHLSGQFSKLLHHRSRSSDESESEDEYGNYDSNAPMDLSLGKEHAGGGNRGRRAKLGKLIIHDEGLKMLDLVVAANIGVWWTTWGRTL